MRKERDRSKKEMKRLADKFNDGEMDINGNIEDDDEEQFELFSPDDYTDVRDDGDQLFDILEMTCIRSEIGSVIHVNPDDFDEAVREMLSDKFLICVHATPLMESGHIKRVHGQELPKDTDNVGGGHYGRFVK